jgi:hypothetical protein
MTYAAARAMDTGPDINDIRAARAKQNAPLERKARKALKREAAARARARQRSKRSWVKAANAACDRAYNDTLDLVERSTVANSAGLVPVLEESLRIMDRLVMRLDRLGPAPNRYVHRRFMRELKRGQAEDWHVVRALKRGWSDASFRQAVQHSMTRNARLKAQSEKLGAMGCSQLFDPLVWALS